MYILINLNKVIYSLALTFLLLLTSLAAYSQSQLIALATTDIINIDGLADESDWSAPDWYPIDQTWIGATPSAADFTGRFKLLWDQNYLYVLVEIQDNILSDDHLDPLTNWWDDDGIELLIDEDRSKGNHQYNYNAFAYHVSLTYDVVDIGTDQQPHLFNDHINTIRTKNNDTYTWECRVKIYGDSFVYGANNETVVLTAGKKMGFSMSYNDNDAGNSRENFMGSGVVDGSDKNVGYITADYFQELTLKSDKVLSLKTEKTIKNHVQIYPNPSDGLLNIELNNFFIEKLEIFTLEGLSLHSQMVSGMQKVTFDLSNYQRGIYFVVITGDQTISKRLEIY